MIHKILVLILISLLLASCSQVLNKIGSEYMKSSLTDICEDDSACVTAINDQFDSCHQKYKKDWNNYMDSTSAKEDEYLELYANNVNNCIVDENGDTYFRNL